MILSDRSLRELLRNDKSFIVPVPADSQIQPASIDLRLGKEIRFANGMTLSLETGGYAIHPGKFLLAHTEEVVGIPDYLVGQLNGKSSLARRGLLVHSTAGYLDPGFKGSITLELANIGHGPIFVEKEMLIAQLVMIQMTTPADRPYGSKGLDSHYQNQKGATPPHQD